MTSIFANKDIAAKAYTIIAIGVILVAIEAINFLLGHSFSAFGILPRDFGGLIGIVTSPFIHGSVNHLLSNIVPLMVFGSLIILRGISHFYKVSLFIMVITGILVWMLHPVALVVGASGVIFGYFGYLLGNGVFTRNATSILIAFFVVVAGDKAR